MTIIRFLACHTERDANATPYEFVTDAVVLARSHFEPIPDYVQLPIEFFYGWHIVSLHETLYLVADIGRSGPAVPVKWLIMPLD
jgi:hypothetical protein